LKFARRHKLDSLDDSALVEHCNKAGPTAETAFNLLYKRNRDFVVRIAQRYGADPNSALDVLQDTFMYLLKKFPPSGNGLQLTAKLSTLLYPVAKNLTLNQQRKSEPLALMDHEDLAVLAPQWQDSPLAGRDVSPLLSELSPAHQEVMLLRVVDELSLQEIAAALDIPIGTVKSRLHTALQQLKNSDDVKKMLEP